MTLIRRILHLCVVRLFSALGASIAFAVPMTASEISFFQAETPHFTQADDVGFTARAPPMAVSNTEASAGFLDWSLHSPMNETHGFSSGFTPSMFRAGTQGTVFHEGLETNWVILDHYALDIARHRLGLWGDDSE